jgi:hypothetical protein
VTLRALRGLISPPNGRLFTAVRCGAVVLFLNTSLKSVDDEENVLLVTVFEVE